MFILVPGLEKGLQPASQLSLHQQQPLQNSQSMT